MENDTKTYDMKENHINEGDAKKLKKSGDDADYYEKKSRKTKELNASDTALRFLTYRERSSFEVKKHLKAKGFSEEEITEALKYLEEFHYVDDSRYCEAYVRYRMSKGRTAYIIKRELAEKGLTGEVVDITLEEYFDPESEKENACEEAEKILRNSGGEWSDKVKAKIGRRLSSLGYRTGLIYDILNAMSRDASDRGGDDFD